jgi:hypothetical protein
MITDAIIQDLLGRASSGCAPEEHSTGTDAGSVLATAMQRLEVLLAVAGAAMPQVTPM